MRGARGPVGLVVLGAALLAGTLLWLLSSQPARRPAATPAAPAPAPSPQPAPSPAPAPAPAPVSPPPAPAPPPASGLAIVNARVTSLGPFDAQLAWTTTEPARTGVGYSLADEAAPTLWSPARGTAREHTATLSGLSYATGYRVWLVAAAHGRRAAATLDLATPGLPPSLSASVAHGAIALDGEPFFPLMVWGNCPDQYGASIAAGIDLFAQNPCGGVAGQLQGLSGRALSAAVTGEPATDGPAQIGWFYPDEADAKGYTGADLPAAPAAVAGRLSFLTLSNHFYAGADPLPAGRGAYPGLIAKADVVGFDLYPLQIWCDASRLVDDYLAQRQLIALAPGRPTFQWIEASTWQCKGRGLEVTPATVRAESWLAIAAGANGLGFFPGNWSPEIAQAIAQVAHDVHALGPALLGAPLPVRASGPLVASGRRYAGARYLIAVNPTSRPVRATFRMPGLAGTTLSVLGEGRAIGSAQGALVDDFAPLAVHVYVAPPP